MLRLILLLCAVSFAWPVAAQEAADSLARWRGGVVGTINASQAAYSNWTQGGLNTIAVTTALDVRAERQTTSWGETHTVRLAYGLLKQDTLSVRKAEDIIRLETSVRYRGGGFFRRFQPTLAVTFRSQFRAGFNYDRNPFNDGRRPPVKVSDFFAPATLNQAVGLTYQPAPWIRQRFGIGAKETFVAIVRLRPLYNMSHERYARVEAGFEARTDIDYDVMENVHYASSLGLFAAFNKPETPDIIWDNELALTVNRWLKTNIQASLLFDRDQSPHPQIKELLSIGLAVKFI